MLALQTITVREKHPRSMEGLRTGRLDCGNDDGNTLLLAENPPLGKMHLTAGNPQLGTWLNMGPGAHYAAQPRQALDDQIWLCWEKWKGKRSRREGKEEEEEGTWLGHPTCVWPKLQTVPASTHDSVIVLACNEAK